MTWRWTLLLCALALAAPALVRTQETPGLSYQQATTPRGTALASTAPIPAPGGAAAAPAGGLQELILTGVTGLPSGHWAWITVAESGQPSKLFALRVGQKLGDLELREIDFKAGLVRVRHRGADVELNFKTHSTLNQKVRSLVESRDYVEQVRPFVEEHTRSHELRELREKQRREQERAEAERELAARAGPPSGSAVASELTHQLE